MFTNPQKRRRRAIAAVFAMLLAAATLSPARIAWAGAPSPDAAGEESAERKHFTDAGDESVEKAETAGLACAAGIMIGTGAVDFSPRGDYTAERIIISLMNAYGVPVPATEIDEQDTPLGALSAPERPELARSDEVLALVNAERARRNLATLSGTEALRDAATVRATELETVFSHMRPDGASSFSVLDEFGITRGASAENAAYGYTTPESVVANWMDSEGHRDNILSPNFTRASVGVHESESGVIYWIILFTE